MHSDLKQTNKTNQNHPPKNPKSKHILETEVVKKIKTNNFILPSCWMKAKWENGGILRFQITGSKRAGKTSKRLSVCSFSNFWTGPLSCAWWEETVEDYCIFFPQMTQKHLVSECDTSWGGGGRFLWTTYYTSVTSLPTIDFSPSWSNQVVKSEMCYL